VRNDSGRSEALAEAVTMGLVLHRLIQSDLQSGTGDRDHLERRYARVGRQSSGRLERGAECVLSLSATVRGARTQQFYRVKR
jgi:hypothetical protein